MKATPHVTVMPIVRERPSSSVIHMMTGKEDVQNLGVFSIVVLKEE
jgi:hypothetical protein